MPHTASLPLLRPTWPSVLLHQASPVTQLTPVKKNNRFEEIMSQHMGEKIRKKKKEKYKRKKNSHMMHQKLKAWISLAQQRRQGRKKEKEILKNQTLDL